MTVKRLLTAGLLFIVCAAGMPTLAMNIGLRTAMWHIGIANRNNTEELHVSFEPCGGKFVSDIAITQKCDKVYGELPTVFREGYAFEGWYLGVTNGAPVATEGADVLAKEDHVLFAKWSLDEALVPGGESIFKWELITDDTIRITGFKKSSQKISTVYFPDTIGGRAVLEIAVGAFANSRSGMQKVVMPMFCTRIGDKAFIGVSSLRSAEFVDVLQWDNPSLGGLLTIGSYAFSGTSLTSLMLPKSVVALGHYAFANCRYLSNVTILGRPLVGLMPLRSSGIYVGGVTVHLDPELANDVAYMAALKQLCANVFVRADAVVKRITLSSLSVSGNEVAILVDVEKAAEWGEVDGAMIKVTYRAYLGAEPIYLEPSSVEKNADGSYTVKVEAPEEGRGFFQVISE